MSGTKRFIPNDHYRNKAKMNKAKKNNKKTEYLKWKGRQKN